MTVNKYPRIITSDIKKFKFALKVDVVKKVAKLSEERQDPNIAIKLENMIEEYFANIR